jgi:regulator of sigma E protease
LTAIPRRTEVKDEAGLRRMIGQIGVRPASGRERLAPGPALAAGVTQTRDVLVATVTYLGKLVRGLVSADELRGPLGIAEMTGKVAKIGASGEGGLTDHLLGAGVNLLLLTGVISVSIGFMNLLPIPVLDGGHLLFYAYEAVARRPLGARVQAAGYRVGLALVLGLMLFATWNDLQRLRVFKFLGGLLS